MTRRAAPREPEWRPPADNELVVLRRQIEQQIAAADEIKTKPYENSGWGSWDSNLGDLIERALGPKSAQATSYHWSGGGGFAGGPSRRDFYSAEAYEAAQVEERNKSISAKITSARGALQAIDLDMERRGVRVTEGGAALPPETFSFVASADTRTIAFRDYEELRIAARTVKARALLAGSVVEAVLLDALERKGVARTQVAKMTFHELIQRARDLQVITPRTAKVADSLRDMRNLVHPAVELREGALRTVDADAAVSLMALVLEEAR